jgi:hypothetical protein
VADTANRDPAIAGVLKRPFAEQVAFFRAKLGNLVPTATWTDMLRAAHDRGFMVAGAQSADLLADLGAAVDRAVTEGVGIEAFRKDFQAIVAKHGWAYNGEVNWRTRTIYRTNIATSYAAGRLAQLRDGGFTHYLYKHGDSVEPRMQHLAWDGLVLPADHPFWKAHYPPNGWGCSCRVVGLRNPEDATALGGDPNKSLPDDWQAIDPKTGAPIGIGKGWDYAPGDTVSDAVAQMAAKTQHWDYTLAKAYMQGVPEAQRDALAQAYRALPSVATDTRLYAQRILEGRDNLDVPPYRTLGLLTSEQAAMVQHLSGRAVAGFDYAMDRSVVGHVLSKHGDAAVESRRGQRAVTAADYARLPQILSNPDAVEDAGVGWSTGQPVILMRRRFGDEEFVSVWEIRGGRKSLALLSFWIKKIAAS